MIVILSFIRKTTILKNVSIAQMTDGSLKRNFYDKAELVSVIDSIPPPAGADTVLYIKCGCGREYLWTTTDDIPTTNFDCVCGQKVIEYG